MAKVELEASFQGEFWQDIWFSLELLPMDDAHVYSKLKSINKPEATRRSPKSSILSPS